MTISLMRSLLSTLSLLHFLLFMDGMHAQDQAVGEPTSAPTPYTEFPKKISFTMSLYMEGGSFNGAFAGNQKVYTLSYLYRWVLCNRTFELPTSQCLNNAINTSSPAPTPVPTTDPSRSPTKYPTPPTVDPTTDPTRDPTRDPTKDPTRDPTSDPTKDPTRDPTEDPTRDP